MSIFLRTAAKRSIWRNALAISAVVGTILNLINQGGTLWAGAPLAWGHIVLNYLVPYCVATYSAVRNELGRGEQA